MQLYDKTFSTLAYPFCLFVCSMCGFLLLWWSSIYWCEHMWELLVVTRVMEIPLRSYSWVGFPAPSILEGQGLCTTLYFGYCL